MAEPMKLPPWKRLQLLHELADGQMSQPQLAEKYGITPQYVSRVYNDNKEKVEAIRRDRENEFAGLWIADKKNRVAAYEEMAERLHDSDDPKLLARYQTALKSVAEELGALPTKTQLQVDPVQVSYKVEGLEAGDLQ